MIRNYKIGFFGAAPRVTPRTPCTAEAPAKQAAASQGAYDPMTQLDMP
ncbi:MAG TPA: hypothetical protein VFD36_31160 [Kofleriaceae bacterium]|nr:hypothetical protein [Kofleriaceae bacterium]